jgi:hypothetical protein
MLLQKATSYVANRYSATGTLSVVDITMLTCMRLYFKSALKNIKSASAGPTLRVLACTTKNFKAQLVALEKMKVKVLKRYFYILVVIL